LPPSILAHPLRLCRAAAIAAALLTPLVGCDTVPFTGREQLNVVDPATAAKLGEQAFAEVKAKSPISHDPAANAMVDRVAKRLAAASDLKEDWEFIVIAEPQVVNAFALPGGKVAVYAGLLPVAQDDAGLATVLGHEIGHVMAHHAAERITRQQLIEAGTNLVTAALGGNPQSQQTMGALLGAGVTFGLELPFSREQEYEADHIGLDLMARAGYDPRTAIAFWQRMQAHAGAGGTPEFFSDHPSDANRIARLQALMPEAMSYYKPAS
jgi:predicted Zn-dependent protease